MTAANERCKGGKGGQKANEGCESTLEAPEASKAKPQDILMRTLRHWRWFSQYSTISYSLVNPDVSANTMLDCLVRSPAACAKRDLRESSASLKLCS